MKYILNFCIRLFLFLSNSEKKDIGNYSFVIKLSSLDAPRTIFSDSTKFVLSNSRESYW